MYSEHYKSFVLDASRLGDYQSMTKTELANGYCDADDRHDDIKRSQYFSALMLRYWYKVGELYESSSSLSKAMSFEIEDYISLVAESLSIGLSYRRWRDPKNKLYNDPNGPDKVFQRCFLSTRQRYYTYSNKQKRNKNAYLAQIVGDSETFSSNVVSESVVFENLDVDRHSSATLSLVEGITQHLIDRNKLLEAITVDCIAYSDSFINKKLNNKTTAVFSQKKLASILASLNDKYEDYFCNTYFVDKEELSKVITKLSTISYTTLERYIKNTLNLLRNNKEIKNLLCM